MRRLLILLLLAAAPLSAQGVLELSTSTTTRARLTSVEVTALIPATRGQFTMPAPWNTTAWRITNPTLDCGGTACVIHTGYSYLGAMNNSAGSDTLYMMASLYGNGGETLFSLTKSTGAITKVGTIFSGGDPEQGNLGDQMFFSPTYPTRVYFEKATSSAIESYVDVLTHVKTDVFDIGTNTALFGSSRHIWQTHISHDDNVFSFIVKNASDESLGCGIYRVSDATWKYYLSLGFAFDECQIDQSGQYVLIKEDITALGPAHPGDRVIRLSDDREADRNTSNGGGHSDNGYGVTVMLDEVLSAPGFDLLDLTASPLTNGTIVYQDPDYIDPYSTDYVSFLNATSAPLTNQYAVGSAANILNGPRANEIFAFKLDGSQITLSIAPTLIVLTGGSYEEHTFGNVDPTGRYVLWTANKGVFGGALDVFVVYIPPVTGFEGGYVAGASPMRWPAFR